VLLYLSAPTAPAELHTLSLHDALPISRPTSLRSVSRSRSRTTKAPPSSNGSTPPTTVAASATTTSPCSPGSARRTRPATPTSTRSEEHTSELQSRENLVCRLLLEKKKQ